MNPVDGPNHSDILNSQKNRMFYNLEKEIEGRNSTLLNTSKREGSSSTEQQQMIPISLVSAWVKAEMSCWVRSIQTIHIGLLDEEDDITESSDAIQQLLFSEHGSAMMHSVSQDLHSIKQEGVHSLLKCLRQYKSLKPRLASRQAFDNSVQKARLVQSQLQSNVLPVNNSVLSTVRPLPLPLTEDLIRPSVRTPPLHPANTPVTATSCVISPHSTESAVPIGLMDLAAYRGKSESICSSDTNDLLVSFNNSPQ